MPTDAELVARVLLDDDRHAFAALVRRYQSAVRGLLRRLTAGDAALADDLAQETFIIAYRRLSSWRAEGKLCSWLYQIAVNARLAHGRTHRARFEQPHASPEREATQPGAPGEGLHLQHDLERAMSGLAEPERAAIALCYGTDLTHEEAAEVLGCPLGTLKTNVLRGKAKLKQQLVAWEPPTRRPTAHGSP